MASKSPIIKQVALLSLLPQLALLASLMAFAHLLKLNNFILWGAFFYLMISFLLRRGIPTHHRRGVALTKKGACSEAIPFFEKSYDFFKRNAWLDKYRFFTLLSSSRISYTEMALLNLAFCYGQCGDGIKSKEFYERTINEFPDSEIAKASLRMLESARNIDEPIKIVE